MNLSNKYNRLSTNSCSEIRFHSENRRSVYMKREMIMLKTINDVKAFVNSVVKCDFDVDLTSGRYTVDAKSIMGIFSLDLSKPIKVEIHSDNCEKFLEEIKPYIQ